MQFLKRTPIERIIRRLERHPAAVVTLASLGMRMGKDVRRMKAGDIDVVEFRRRGFTHVGSISGGMAGAAMGAAAGTAVAPGIGTILGAFTGSVVGDNVGTRLGRAAIEHAEVQVGRTRSASMEEDGDSVESPEPEPDRPTRRHI
ncbi:MAG: hypothetical protein ACFB9M_11720 [Myxococcota bacterium]